VSVFIHRIFGPTRLSKGEKLPNRSAALDKCSAALRGFEFAMEFRRENFIRIYFPVFLANLLPTVDTDGRRRMMVRGMATHASQSVKTLLEIHFPYYYPMLAMQNSLKDVNTTIISLRAFGVEPEISASIQTQVNYRGTSDLFVHILERSRRTRFPTFQTFFEFNGVCNN